MTAPTSSPSLETSARVPASFDDVDTPSTAAFNLVEPPPSTRSSRPRTPETLPLPIGSSAHARPARPALDQPRRSSTTSTSTSSSTSNASSLLHLAASSLKTRNSASTTKPTQRKTSDRPSKGKKAKRGGKRGAAGDTLDAEWSTAEFENDQKQEQRSEDMTRTNTSVSTSSQRSIASSSSKTSTALGSTAGGGGGGGGGKFVQSLRRTRSKLGLMAGGGKGKESEGSTPAVTEPVPISTAPPSRESIAQRNGTDKDDGEDDGMMVQSPVLTFVEPPSPSESRTFSQDFDDHEAVTPSIISTSPTNSSFFTTPPSSTSIPHSASTTQRIGGWFSSMLNSSTSSSPVGPAPAQPLLPSSRSSSSSSPTTSPEKSQQFALRQRGSSHSPSSTRTFFSSSPTKKLSHSSLSLPPSSSTGAANPGSSASPASTSSRLGPLDRMLDKAVQYFLDTDSNADKCPDDIWLLGGVRHEGWRPSAHEGTAEEVDVYGGGKKPEHATRRWSPVKSRSNTSASKQQRRQRETSAATIAESDHSRRDDSPSPSLRSFSTTLSAESGSPSLVASSESAPTTINGWPASFYRDFYSRPALTYRTNFAPIPCSPATPGSRIGSGATGTMHGMFNSLSLSIGRGGGARDAARDDGAAGGLSSDTGWGCMLRTGQSLLANALVSAHLGRDWRRPLPPASLPAPSAHGQPSPPISTVVTLPEAYATYTRILSLFLDSPASTSPFSVHKFALEGQRLGKSVGEWFGPSTAAGAIKKLVNDYAPAGIQVVSCVDGTLYENEVVAASRNWGTKVLVLLNLRLGIDGVNPIYHEAIKGIFRIPQSVGIAGGRPSSSYYFVGTQANSLFYIDPHHPRPAVSPIDVPSELVPAISQTPLSPPLPEPSSRDSDVNEARAMLDSFFATAYDDAAWRTYHCDRVRKCALSSLDPSMLVGFLVQDADDWRDLKLKASELGQASSAIFSIAPSPPKWMRRSSSAVPVPPGPAPPQPSLSVSPGEDSFSELDEDSIVDRPASGEDRSKPAETSGRGVGGVDDDDDGEFSEPEGWELDSTDASDAESLERGEAASPRPAPPPRATAGSGSRLGPAKSSTIDADDADREDEDADDDSDPVFVDSRTSLRSRESTREAGA